MITSNKELYLLGRNSNRNSNYKKAYSLILNQLSLITLTNFKIVTKNNSILLNYSEETSPLTIINLEAKVNGITKIVGELILQEVVLLGSQDLVINLCI